jgi:hypothetical protein
MWVEFPAIFLKRFFAYQSDKTSTKKILVGVHFNKCNNQASRCQNNLTTIDHGDSIQKESLLSKDPTLDHKLVQLSELLDFQILLWGGVYYYYYYYYFAYVHSFMIFLWYIIVKPIHGFWVTSSWVSIIYISSTTTERLFPATIINPLLLKYSSVLCYFLKKYFLIIFILIDVLILSVFLNDFNVLYLKK